MLWRWSAIFGGLCAGYAVLFILNFCHYKYGAQKAIFGLNFSSYWTFLTFFLLIVSPLIIAANYFFFSAYYFGFKVWTDVFGSKIWIVHLTNSAATIFTLLVLSWICFQEVPARGTLAGLILAIAAVLVSIFWK